MAETVTMPKLGFDMAEGTLVRWVKGEGDPVAKGEVLAEIETDKATVEVESSFSGMVTRHLVEKGSVVPVGTPIAVITAPGEKLDATEKPAIEDKKPGPIPPITPASPVSITPQVMPIPVAGPILASPLARRMAQEEGVNLASLRGSGPGGRIVRRDIEDALAAKPVAASVLEPPAPILPVVKPSQIVESTPIQVSEDQVIPLDRLRAAIGRRMVEAKQQVPHFYVTHEINMEALMGLRKQLNNLMAEEQKQSVNDFIVKAVALSLTQFPNLNASLEVGGIHRHQHINVGVAVALEGGLLTVVCRDTAQKSLSQISGEVKQMVARARQGKVKPEDIRSGYPGGWQRKGSPCGGQWGSQSRNADESYPVSRPPGQRWRRSRAIPADAGQVLRRTFKVDGLIKAALLIRLFSLTDFYYRAFDRYCKFQPGA
jgi:pyruvate dehydrogenase E2 component (dihydrolipoamide acetyltransferase)